MADVTVHMVRDRSSKRSRQNRELVCRILYVIVARENYSLARRVPSTVTQIHYPRLFH